jgi:integrase
VAQNVALSVKVGATRGERKRLKIGTDIPSVEEIRKILKVLDGLEGKSRRLRPALMTVIFTGLRASELRGLRWDDVDLKRGEITVRQRADKFRQLGLPKTRAGTERKIPIGPELVSMLREWKLANLANPNKGELGLAFPSPKGEIDQHTNIVRKFELVVRDAGLLDRLGNAKYTGLHSLRHFYASWCINRKEDGGLGLPPKVVQDRLGHSSITMTMDVYGHLFPRSDDGSELVRAERALWGGGE